jgi:hypothetical protein
MARVVPSGANATEFTGIGSAPGGTPGPARERAALGRADEALLSGERIAIYTRSMARARVGGSGDIFSSTLARVQERCGNDPAQWLTLGITLAMSQRILAEVARPPARPSRARARLTADTRRQGRSPASPLGRWPSPGMAVAEPV